MTKGSLLLVATSALEARIIISFLEAADYGVTDISSLPSLNSSRLPVPVHAAIVVMENDDSSLAEVCNLIRRTTRRERLPIVAVVVHSPAQAPEALWVLERPIRLFDLAHAVDRAVAAARRDGSTEPSDLHNIRT
jgi:hypothetical protein